MSLVEQLRFPEGQARPRSHKNEIRSPASEFRYFYKDVQLPPRKKGHVQDLGEGKDTVTKALLSPPIHMGTSRIHPESTDFL